MEFIESFPYIIKYKQGKENVVADALSRRYVLTSTLDSRLLGFEYIKELYEGDEDFGEIYRACDQGPIRISLGKKGTCSERISYVSLGALYENYYYVSPMERA